MYRTRELRAGADRWFVFAPRCAVAILVVLTIANTAPFANAADDFALPGRVLDKNGQPVRDADIRVHLVSRMPQHTRFDYEWLRTWQLRTDAQGNYSIEGLKNAGRAQALHIDIVASGFVDAQREFPLSKFLGDSPSRTLPEVRLERGVRLSGRCVDAATRPIKAATIYCVSASAQSEQDPSLPLLEARPRITDHEGRFSLFVPVDAKTKVFVCSDQWAPTRIVAPPGQQDLGDIQLQAGTRVRVTLLNTTAQPLIGYWVLAENVEGVTSRDFPVSGCTLRVIRKTDTEGKAEFPDLLGDFKFSVCSKMASWPTEEPVRSPEPQPAVIPLLQRFDGSQRTLDLTLKSVPTVRIRGSVVHRDGQPAKGITLYLTANASKRDAQANIAIVMTDAQGRFAFENIPSGLKDVLISVLDHPGETRKDGAMLYAKPLPHVKGARWDGHVSVDELKEDLEKTDFQFRLFRSGFLE